MYQEKFVTAVLVAGKVLREHKDTVYLPFGQDFALRFKNLNSVRALVRVSIDGQDATEGTSGLVVPANDTVNLERFIKNGNLAEGNKFKFIERTSKIESGSRGVRLDDGLVRVEFEFERQPAKVEDTIRQMQIYKTYVHDYKYYQPYPRPLEFWCSTSTQVYPAQNGGGTGSGDLLSRRLSASTTEDLLNRKLGATATASSDDGLLMNTYANDVGITVPGGLSEQKFEQGAWFPTDGQKHVMILKLLGTHGEIEVTKPVTVKMKQKCSTCGHVNKSGMKFCGECGTALQLV